MQKKEAEIVFVRKNDKLPVMKKFLLISVLLFDLLNAKSDEQYFEAGITISSLVHPSIGYWKNGAGIRFSGMYQNDAHYEYNINLGYEISENDTMQSAVNLLTSWVTGSDPGAKYHYAATGMAYSINYRGFFVELGLAVPWRDEIGNLSDDFVIPCGYFGYLYRFKE